MDAVQMQVNSMVFVDLPIYLSLLVDNAMGFFSGYPAMEP